ncbi:MAG: glycosyltransferase family 2 protein [Chloroflexi bacterium]|jgi:undecaprenyl-phosphate 4-deoxy-4-formamido-L-arabinose transferase|nr:glycosyltransferase family 2 protein [Chloroflexota bacterium]
MIKTFSIVIPVYNSQGSLPILVKEIDAVMDREGWEHEIILVNDGSQDESWQVIEELASVYPSIRAFNLMRNYGQHNALLCGIRQAKNEVIITLDDDLQHPPGEIPKLLAKMEEGYDVVYGAPEEEKHSFWRNITSKLIKYILRKAMKISSAQTISAFRAFRTEVREAFSNYSGTYVSIDVLLSWGTTRFTSITVKHNERTIGKSRYTLKKLMNYAFTLITGFSILPLQVSSFLGFLSIIFGFIVLVYVVVRYILSGGVVPGFTFLASTLAIFSGVTLFAIGMIGEYLGRLFTRSLDYPPFTIRSEITSDTIRQQLDRHHPEEIKP